MPRWGWDQTNFGLFSGDDRLGAFVARNVYEAAERLRANGSSSPNAATATGRPGGRVTPGPGMTRRCRPSRSSSPSTLHRGRPDRGRSVEEPRRRDLPRFLQHRPLGGHRRGAPGRPAPRLRRFPGDVSQPPRELLLHRRGRPAVHGRIPAPAAGGRQNIKADQLRATGAKLVCTMCHNCVDGLNDVIKHYKLPMRVVQVLELVSNALVLPGERSETGSPSCPP